MPKRTAPPAAPADGQRGDAAEGMEDSRPPSTASDPAERGRAGSSARVLDPAVRDRTGMERVGGGPRKLRPPELLAEAIATPADARLKGRPMALVDVLARSNDRTAKKNAVVVYWRLAIAAGPVSLRPGGSRPAPPLGRNPA